VLVPCFLLILCFRKVTREIFSELDQTKAKPPILIEASRRSKMRWRGARSQAHHRGARPSPWPRHPMVRPGGPPPDVVLSPISSPRREKPKGTDLFSMKHTASHRRRHSEIGRIQELFPAPYRRGKCLPEAFYSTMIASGVMCE
jgi:hypothetical protein